MYMIVRFIFVNIPTIQRIIVRWVNKYFAMIGIAFVLTVDSVHN